MKDKIKIKPHNIDWIHTTIIMQEAQYDTKAIFVFDGCVIISFGLTTNQEDDSTCNN